MTKVIEVDQAKVRIPKEDLENNVNIIDEYVSLLNGISYVCRMYDEYSEGYRNTVAVDLTVASYMLGLDAQEVLRKFIVAGLIDPSNDDEVPANRVGRVLDYRYKFDWDWMIDPDGYLSYGDVTEDDVTLFFKLVD